MAYVTRSEFLASELIAAAFSGLATSTIDDALDRASSVVDSYLRKRHKLPLTSPGGDVKTATRALAALDLLTDRGFNPESRADVAIVKAADDQRAWLKDVARGLCEIEGTDATPDTDEAGPVLTQGANQGRARLWTRTRC